MNCLECKYYKVYRGSRDWYGMQLEPDDSECMGNPTEKDLDKYYTDGEEWEVNEEGCSGFKRKMTEDDIDYDMY